MSRTRNLSLAAALLVGGSALATAAFAAATAMPDQSTDPARVTVISTGEPYKLDTEMTVKNWIICISEDGADQLVKAHERSAEEGQKVLASLRAGKACGEFPELHVILQKSLYEPAPGATYHARVFDALIQFSGEWAKGYLVSSGE